MKKENRIRRQNKNTQLGNKRGQVVKKIENLKGSTSFRSPRNVEASEVEHLVSHLKVNCDACNHCCLLLNKN
jgi:hypothetical protein